MKTNQTNNNLRIWIAENGDKDARDRICNEAKLCRATLSRIVGGHKPKFEIRYRIYKLTGVKLDESDDFPSLSIIVT